MKEQIDIISSIAKEYNIKGKITVKFSNEMSDDDFAQTVKHTIEFNTKALRSRQITNTILNSDNYLSSADVNGIAIHEMGHIISKQYGEKGLELARKAYYNIYKEETDISNLLIYLEKNISEYSIDIDEQRRKRPFKSKYCKEVLPEIMAKHSTDPDKFTEEFVRLLKEMVL